MLRSRMHAIRPRRVRFGLALLAGMIVALGGADGAIAKTKVIRYDPFTASGAIKQRLQPRYTGGNCWFSSLTDPRDDAWRCMHGNLIEDPCFESPRYDDWVVCPRSPWSRRVIVIRSRLRQSDRAPSGRWFPWALTTTTGRWHCVLVAGATGVFRGKRANYACANGWWLLGLPNQHPSTWRIYAARDISGVGWRRVRIRTAWT
jgi:hypothetical protein